jgi:hypothetical protein
MALHTHPTGRGGEQTLPRLELVADWPRASEAPSDCSWSEYARATFWLVREYLDALGSPASIDHRIARAIWAARIGFLDIAYERDDAELAIATGRSVRSIETARADLRAALIRAGRQLPEPQAIPQTFAGQGGAR